MFRKVRAHRLLLEYDDERSGSFEALRHIPEDKHVVLGLVSTKTPQTPSVDELCERLKAAATIVPEERLAISTQCGFSTSIVGNRITPEDQHRKLERVVAAARGFWGSV